MSERTYKNFLKRLEIVYGLSNKRVNNRDINVLDKDDLIYILRCRSYIANCYMKMAIINHYRGADGFYIDDKHEK
ncbi:gp121 (endogenous virus) [Lactococcus phage KSY1]|uniref:Gp121 n=1 Tax=Lactococcus phage KSY1 TaxID=2913972 RepID=A6MAI6_9CAUD|nr:gp121 [Lactococcus phage KSY1]ABG21664.1 gp121 [Lactococcus phage KSY1]